MASAFRTTATAVLDAETAFQPTPLRLYTIQRKYALLSLSKPPSNPVLLLFLESWPYTLDNTNDDNPRSNT